ncbi:carboxymuconolactone decarboxylase family protein [Hymenobacter caeli]|uniref:4-carboxymuconolactone decarboxylase n=1 Tax=Hymenobacter caeli TaxID=2735894 RepID=A0ABX2FVB4_9BACT|nr:carboxymuconolactone decarboxylase family protein [Hymenobacter caeli]NRT21145.1 4-carboxymuconolactone decarboxylase [Hymenobacter caeli]
MMSTASDTAAERYARGWAKLREVDGEAGEQVINSLCDISPDLSRYLIEYCFGDIYARGKLDLKTTELVVVAALAAMGTAEPQLRVHLHGALNTGNSRQEVVEALLQVAVFAGFPAALKGIVAAREVFAARDEQGKPDAPLAPAAAAPAGTRPVRGEEALERLKAGQLRHLHAEYDAIAPDVVGFIVDFCFGDVLSRPALLPPLRQLLTVGMVTAKGGLTAELEFHIRAALHLGCLPEAILEIMLLMTVYAGFPAALNGIAIAKKVLAEPTGGPAGSGQ